MADEIGPLIGILVLEWATWHQGAAGAGVMLSDLGAQVIKIEEPRGGDTLRGAREMFGVSAGLPGGRNVYFEASNRNKRSITLDLKQEAGREVAYRLVSRCDIFTTNFRPGIARKLGMDYPTLSRYNPKLIYLSTPGYGHRSQAAERRSYDWIGLAHSGMMWAAGERDMPPLPVVGMVADQMGAVVAAYAALAALVARERLGVGQEVHTSMLSSMLWLQYINLTTTLLRGRSLRRGTRSRAPNPLASYYRCADDKWLMLCHPQSDRFWGQFCRAIGRPELEHDLRFTDMDLRRQNSQELVALLDEVFASRPRAEWLEVLGSYDLTFSPLNDMDEVPGDPEVLAGGCIGELEYPEMGRMRVVNPPAEFGRTPARPRSPAPELGQHTEEVLRELGGYSWDEISVLREQGAI
ncbi:MAG: CoA transferase [Chloroflexota bacterium]